MLPIARKTCVDNRALENARPCQAEIRGWEMSHIAQNETEPMIENRQSWTPDRITSDKLPNMSAKYMKNQLVFSFPFSFLDNGQKSPISAISGARGNAMKLNLIISITSCNKYVYHILRELTGHFPDNGWKSQILSILTYFSTSRGTKYGQHWILWKWIHGMCNKPYMKWTEVSVSMIMTVNHWFQPYGGR